MTTKPVLSPIPAGSIIKLDGPVIFPVIPKSVNPPTLPTESTITAFDTDTEPAVADNKSVFASIKRK